MSGDASGVERRQDDSLPLNLARPWLRAFLASHESCLPYATAMARARRDSNASQASSMPPHDQVGDGQCLGEPTVTVRAHGAFVG